MNFDIKESDLVNSVLDNSKIMEIIMIHPMLKCYDNFTIPELEEIRKKAINLLLGYKQAKNQDGVDDCKTRISAIDKIICNKTYGGK